MPSVTQSANSVSVAIIGAGFSGIGLAIRLLQSGRKDFVIFEKGDDVGGVWRENTYPGAACDVPSHLYSFSFEPNPDWGRKYSGQAEIYAYLQHCAKKHDLQKYIRFNSTVAAVDYVEEEGVWDIALADGSKQRARCVVGAQGSFNRPSMPKVPGLDAFSGPVMHTAEWDESFDFSGKRVAVIGTGASAIQVVPQLQKRVNSLKLFQRTPAWVLPKFDGARSEVSKARFRRFPLLQRLARWRQFIQFERLTPIFIWYGAHTRLASVLGRRYLKFAIKNPALRKTLTPDYALGCKRVLLSDDYYPALTKDNVEVISGGAASVDTNAVIDNAGGRHEVDAIVCATGFDIPTRGCTLPVKGVGGRVLNDDWSTIAEGWMGLHVSGYPNFMLMMGPNTGAGNNSVVFYIESQIHYILKFLDALDKRPNIALDLKENVLKAFNKKLQKRMLRTTWTSGCQSWYLNDDGRNSTLWPGFALGYRLALRRFSLSRYTVLTTKQPAEKAQVLEKRASSEAANIVTGEAA